MSRRQCWRNTAAGFLLVTGTFQMAGWALNCLPLRGLGALCGWAPFPKVFCDMEGYEGFTAQFYLEGETADGEAFEVELTPEVYQRIQGPYNRRNVYGALLAGGPRLPQPLGETLMKRALQPGAPLWAELGLPPQVNALAVRVVPRTGAVEGPWCFPVIDKQEGGANEEASGE